MLRQRKEFLYIKRKIHIIIQDSNVIIRKYSISGSYTKIAKACAKTYTWPDTVVACLVHKLWQRSEFQLEHIPESEIIKTSCLYVVLFKI